MVAKPKEKSTKKRPGGLAAELKRAAREHQSAKNIAEKRGVQVPQHLATPLDHLLDATTTPQIQALSNHLANIATAIRSLSATPYKRVGNFGSAIKRTNPMTATELAAASTKVAEDRAAAAATAVAIGAVTASDQRATAPPPAATTGSQTDAQKVEAAIEKANKWLAVSAALVLGGGDETVQFNSNGSAVTTEMVMVRDEADTLGRIQEVDDLHEVVFQRSAGLGNELAGIGATTQTSMVLHGAIGNIGRVFDALQSEYNAGALSVADARDAVTMLLGEVKQLSDLILQMGGDGRVDTVVDLEQAGIFVG